LTEIAKASSAADEALMLRYQRGDAAAFAELVRRHKTPVFNFVLRQVRVASAAEDITQEAFLRVVQRAAEFKHEARFSTWLYTIARNLCIDAARKGRLRMHPSLDAPANDDGSRTLLETVPDRSPDTDVGRAAEWTRIRRSIVMAVDALPDDQREVFLLREVANLPFKEISEVTGTPENTVKSRMRYALERLRMALSEFEEYARALR
jgi:RNA polymerase sigma-70 factor (ECF subfamily)